MGDPKERPILFSAPMVRAILDGTKTQTRRAVKPMHAPTLAPYAEPGDRLWVREKHRVTAWNEIGRVRVEYAADGAEDWVDAPMDDYDDWVYRRCEIWERAGAKADVESGLMAPPPGGIPWTPSIHMPRWASRITLEVTSVRVERLHDITKDDAIAEGAHAVDGPIGPWGNGPRWSMERPHPVEALGREEGHKHCLGTPQMAFANLWNRINGPDSWDANAWVWVVSFQKLEVPRG